MLPFVYGFTWSIGNIIFLGIFFAVVTVIVATLAVIVRRAIHDAGHQEADAIRWHADFHELPAAARTCRHQYTGEFARRTCDNEFDCRSCATHAKLLAIQPAETPGQFIQRIGGFELPLDRFYHRGHTWVKPEADGTLTIGLDELASRMIGSSGSPILPAPGTSLRMNGQAWTYRTGHDVIRILAPVDGEVVAVGTPADRWLLKVKPADPTPNLGQLLRGRETGLWFQKELERFQLLLADEHVGVTMADGGTPVDDFRKVYPQKNWDRIYGDMFLEA